MQCAHVAATILSRPFTTLIQIYEYIGSLHSNVRLPNFLFLFLSLRVGSFHLPAYFVVGIQWWDKTGIVHAFAFRTTLIHVFRFHLIAWFILIWFFFAWLSDCYTVDWYEGEKRQKSAPWVIINLLVIKWQQCIFLSYVSDHPQNRHERFRFVSSDIRSRKKNSSFMAHVSLCNKHNVCRSLG